MKQTAQIKPGTRAFKRVFGEDLDQAKFPLRQRGVEGNEVAVFYPGGFETLDVYPETEAQREKRLDVAEELYRRLETSRTIEFISISKRAA